ncbi:DNA polymerase III subunit delta [Coxiella burnetii]|uniref:DNA polymerase III subunit delta n=1 Tax=Coxiella burnetii TaxID=777 RepID=UPI000F52B173|nr:DNA polymerase III subunit delta [Coxiella burnetii]RQM79994.1 DNA polymerase III subunit delta [Coxiella burnetii]
MQLLQKQLDNHLNRQALLPLYLISGDVSLLVQETRDTIREAARQKGFHQCKLLFVETGFHWQSLTQSFDNFSLLSDKTLIELRNPKAKFDESGTQALLQYLNNPPEDKRLIIITNKLTAAQQKTKWYKAIDRSGAVISLWPLSGQSLLAWIEQRLKKAGLEADNESISLLAELTEGNLLATHQAIEKLRLLHQDESITPKAIIGVVNDNARFTIFDLTQAALMGAKSRVVRILANLYFADKEAGLLILWAITRELRLLYPLAIDYQRGKPLTELLASQWQTRKQPLRTALMRLNTTIIAQLLQQAKRIDHILKGLTPGNAWQELETLSLRMAGVEKGLL